MHCSIASFAECRVAAGLVGGAGGWHQRGALGNPRRAALWRLHLSVHDGMQGKMCLAARAWDTVHTGGRGVGGGGPRCVLAIAPPLPLPSVLCFDPITRRCRPHAPHARSQVEFCGLLVAELDHIRDECGWELDVAPNTMNRQGMILNQVSRFVRACLVSMHVCLRVCLCVCLRACVPVCLCMCVCCAVPG